MQIKPSFGVTAMDVLKFCAESNPSEFLGTVSDGEEAGIVVCFTFLFSVFKKDIVRKANMPILLNTHW